MMSKPFPPSLPAAFAAILVCLALSGCAGFFTNTSTTSTTTTNTGDYVYAVNSTTNLLSSYSVGTGSLTALSGSPLTLTTGLAAQSITVSRPNSFVFVGGSGAIACYTIGTGGVLTASTTGGASQAVAFSSLETSPDGKWLLALGTDNSTLNTDLFVYAINTTTGALTVQSSLVVQSPSTQTVVARQVRIAPSANVVAVALGTAGDVIYAFNTTNGTLTAETNVYAAGYTDNALAFDSNSTYLYIARATTGSGTSGIASYSVTAAGALTPVTALAPSGGSPFALAFDSTGAYLYAANKGDSTVSGYSLASGALTALAGSPFSSNTASSALVRDNSGKYIVALGTSGSSDVTLFGQDAVTAGKLDALANASTGSAASLLGVVSLAATHTSTGL